MTSKPFSSECKNIFNEVAYSVIPSAFGMNNVTATQTKQHSVCDTVSTSIVGSPQHPLPYNPYINNQPQMPLHYTNVLNNGPQNSQVIQAQKIPIPGGVMFSFEPIYQNPNNYLNYTFHEYCIPTIPNPSNQVPYNQDAYYNQQLIQQQIALKQIEKEALELMLIQEHLNKNMMGKLKFHHHGQTSTTDLPENQSLKSRRMPDFNNLMAVLNDLKRELKEMEAIDFSCDCSSALYSQVSTAKRLMLTKSPDLVEKEQRNKEIAVPEVSEHTNSQVEPEQTQNTSESETPKTQSDKSVQSKKKVCFKGFQGKAKKRKPRKSKKKRSKCRRSHSESSSSSSKGSSSDSSQDSDN